MNTSPDGPESNIPSSSRPTLLLFPPLSITAGVSGGTTRRRGSCWSPQRTRSRIDQLREHNLVCLTVSTRSAVLPEVEAAGAAGQSTDRAGEYDQSASSRNIKRPSASLVLEQPRLSCLGLIRTASQVDLLHIRAVLMRRPQAKPKVLHASPREAYNVQFQSPAAVRPPPFHSARPGRWTGRHRRLGVSPLLELSHRKLGLRQCRVGAWRRRSRAS